MHIVTVMLAIIACSMVIPSLVLADTITLKNGQTYEGNVIAEEEDRVQLKMDGSGVRVWISRDQISSMAKAKPDAAPSNETNSSNASATDSDMVDDEVKRARELLDKMRDQSKEAPKKKEKPVISGPASAPETAPGTDAKTKTEVERLVEQVKTSKGPEQITACRKLGELGSEEAIPHLIHFLDNDNYYVRDAANQSLIKITGQDFHFDAKASRSIRLGAIEKWEKWHRNEQRKGADSRLKSFW